MSLTLILSKPDSTKNPKNMELVRAVKDAEVDAVRQLLAQVADVSDMTLACQGDLNMDKRHAEVVKAVSRHRAAVHKSLLQVIFKPRNGHFCRELLYHIVCSNLKNEKLIQMIFHELQLSVYRGPMALDIFQFLLERGLPVNGMIDDDKTPLHYSIINDRVEFVSILLELGADVNKKTSGGMFPLYLATLCDESQIPEMILKRGARVNECTINGRTALHEACNMSRPEIALLLLDKGADVNVLDADDKTPLTDSNSDGVIMEILVKEMAKLKYDGSSICKENLNFMRKNKRLTKFFECCLDELRRLSCKRFYNRYSMYDVLKMRRHSRVLTYLMKNEDFVVALKSHWDWKLFKIYGQEIGFNLGESLERAMILDLEENKLDMVFKDILPKVAIRKIAFFSLEYLFA